MRFIYTKTFAFFSICLVAVVFLVFFEVKGWLDPVKAAFLKAPRPVIYLAKSVAQPVKGFFSTVYHLKKISRENTELNNKILLLQQDIVDYDQIKRENEAFRKELGFVEDSKLQLVPCTVLSQNPFGLTDVLTLNCGSSQGVAEGQAVIAQEHLVGKIIYAGKRTSTMLLVTGSKFSTDAKISKIGLDGIVRGTLGSGIILDQLSQNNSFDKGMLVTTAGINEKIPRGILVGEIGDVLSNQSDLFKKVTIISPIDFGNLGFVFVVK